MTDQLPITIGLKNGALHIFRKTKVFQIAISQVALCCVTSRMQHLWQGNIKVSAGKKRHALVRCQSDLGIYYENSRLENRP